MLQIFVKSSVAHHAIVWANFGGSGSIPGPEFSTQTYQMAKFIGAEGKNCPRQTLNIIFDLKVAAVAGHRTNSMFCHFTFEKCCLELRTNPAAASGTPTRVRPRRT